MLQKLKKAGNRKLKKGLKILSLMFIASASVAPVFAETVTKSGEVQSNLSSSEELPQSKSDEILENSLDQLNQRDIETEDSTTATVESTDESEATDTSDSIASTAETDQIDELNRGEQSEETSQTEESTEAAIKETTDQAGTKAAVTLDGPTERQLPVDTAALEGADNVAVREVTNESEFQSALGLSRDGKNITVIKIKNDFRLTYSGLGRTMVSNEANRIIVIEGNNYAIEFTGRSYQMTNSVDVVVQNLNIGNGNPWGIFDGYTYSLNDNSVYTFHDIKQAGTQIFEGGRSKVILSGETTLENGVSGNPNYISPFDGQTYNFTYDRAYYNSSNIEAGQIYIKEGSNILVRSGMKGANFAITRNGNFYIEPGEPTTVTLDNNIVSSSNIPNWTIADYSPAAIALNNAAQSAPWPNGEVNYEGQTSNLFYIPKSATVEIINGQSRQSKAAVLDFTGTGARAQIDGTLKITSYGDGSRNKGPGGEFSGGEVPVEFRNRGLLALGEDASFEMNITGATYNSGHALMMRGEGSEIRLGKNASFKIRSDSLDTSRNDGTMIYMEKRSAINIGENAIFDIAKTRNGNDNALMRLISTTLKAENPHSIRLWNNQNLSETSNYNWQPLRNTTITYNGTPISSKSTSSTHLASQEGFNANFNTNAHQRVVFEPPTAAVLTIHHQKYKHGTAEEEPEEEEILVSVNEEMDTDFSRYQKNYPGYTYRGLKSSNPDPLPQYMPPEGIEVELEYTYDGSLKMNYPTTYDFGSHAININGLTLTQPKTLDAQGQPTALTITDDRYTTNLWQLTLAETKPLMVNLSGGGTSSLAGCLYYDDLEISSAARMVESDTFAANTETTKNISDTWSETTGLMLKVPIDQQYAGDYSGELTWTLTAGPSNE
ncbi:hypothetical protein JZO70_11160 [Enterococcus sp. 669A]|uniref:WxL domain-containing protein n=1 Tax=Candidatus Enterococcus moelleringii TaxID=2815325 RepID=A0ABS3LEC4_9ENTE|nr:pectate lyase-like adhesive domain-containing protein [Enterococcus sp. 669A]MBO1306724.1 hypothetical protein [Enterococcus sp. 669A]